MVAYVIEIGAKDASDDSGSYQEAPADLVLGSVMVHGARKPFLGNKPLWADSNVGQSGCSRSDAQSSP